MTTKLLLKLYLADCSFALFSHNQVDISIYSSVVVVLLKIGGCRQLPEAETMTLEFPRQTFTPPTPSLILPGYTPLRG